MLAQATADGPPTGDSVALAALDLIDRGIVVTDSLARIQVANDLARGMATRLDAFAFPRRRHSITRQRT
jgi:hypothetical protein